MTKAERARAYYIANKARILAQQQYRRTGVHPESTISPERKAQNSRLKDYLLEHTNYGRQRPEYGTFHTAARIPAHAMEPAQSLTAHRPKLSRRAPNKWHT